MEANNCHLEGEIASARKPSDTIATGNQSESHLHIPWQGVSMDPEGLRRCVEQLWSLPEDCRSDYLEVARIAEADVRRACRNLNIGNPLERRDYGTLSFEERLQLLLVDVSFRHPEAMSIWALECLQEKMPLERVGGLQGVADRDFHRANIRKGSIDQVNAALRCIEIQRLTSGELLDAQNMPHASQQKTLQ